ncbi:hypothetical protein [Nostoc sp.]|uniref:hypothetical protein n=1 Tax=Nostoc sp. TaxID=1180 RepID=UPI002FF760ED
MFSFAMGGKRSRSVSLAQPKKRREENYQTTMAYWLFQGNFKYYRIIDGIRDFEQMPWLATRYAIIHGCW